MKMCRFLGFPLMSKYGAKIQKTVNYAGAEDVGFVPIGVQKMLESVNLTSENYWMASHELFRRGVLSPQTSHSCHVIETKLVNPLQRMYPVNNGAKNFGCVVHESLKNNDYLMRGYHVLGDDSSIAGFWAQMSNGLFKVRGFDLFVSGYVVDRHDTGNCLLSLFRF